MTKSEQSAALAALIAASGKTATRLPSAPMDDSLSASRIVAAPKKTTVEKKQERRAKRAKRNWAAQRRYDEAHGTVNGYDERIEQARAFHDNEMDID